MPATAPRAGGARLAATPAVGLEEYRRKRDFGRTPEPRGRRGRRRAAAREFVVQKHGARRLHYDFRLELDGVLLSWAVPKGPSLVPGERRMAARTEDHPLDYGDFEGVIPAGEYGGGAVVVWDRGHWEPVGDPKAALAKGDLTFRLAGTKLRGRWHLVRMRPRAGDRGKESWLLIKGRDAEAREPSAPPVTETEPRSVLTGRDLEEVARDADRVWSGARGETDAPEVPPPGDPRGLPGARRAPLPRSLGPQLATLVTEAPEGDAWLHELKLDGYRVVCRLEDGAARLVTRAGHDWTDRFPTLAAALEALPVDSALLDGEAVVLDARGRSDFQALQRALGQGRGDLHLFLFDLLYLDGYDLRRAPLVERKRLLGPLLARAPEGSPLRFSDHLRGHGRDFLEEACRSGVEGVVSKRADAAYRSGRTRDWLKVKCTRRQEFVIVGFTEPSGSRAGLGALLLGAHDAEGTLRYTGKVGTGFDADTLLRLRERLGATEQPESPAAGAPRGRGQHWVAPRLVAEVAFTEWTQDGRIRHPSFVGLREDKPAGEVRIERPEPAPAPAREASAAARGASPARARLASPAAGPPPLRAEVAGVRLSTPDRVYFPELGITKSELAQYYERMADRVLPGLVQRPLSLVRCPEGREGECFYQKRADRSIPKAVPRVVVKQGREPYAMVDGLPSLVALVQVGVLELHVWGARADRLDRPDIVVFDLDPDPSVPWRRVADTARLLRGLLEELGLVAFVRSTGGKGLHVVVPLVRRSTWDDVKGFAQAVALQLVRAAPEHFTAQMAKARRRGKIFVDYLRNDLESTAIASWSVRARPGAPVAAPLAWEELQADERPVVSLRDAPARLARPDPWADFEASRRSLTKEMRRRVGAAG